MLSTGVAISAHMYRSAYTTVVAYSGMMLSTAVNGTRRVQRTVSATFAPYGASSASAGNVATPLITSALETEIR